MSVEFVDTNILVYAHDRGSGGKHQISVELLTRLFEHEAGALSVQVLAEFYWVGTRKLGMSSLEAEAVIGDLGSWTIHRPGHSDLLKAAQIHRRHKMAWWDAMVVNSAIETGSVVLWSEDLGDGRRFGSLTVRNPYR